MIERHSLYGRILGLFWWKTEFFLQIKKKSNRTHDNPLFFKIQKKKKLTGNDGFDDHVRRVTDGLYPEYTSGFLIGIANVYVFFNRIVRYGNHGFQLVGSRVHDGIVLEELELSLGYHG